jgi:hypothetical protein
MMQSVPSIRVVVNETHVSKWLETKPFNYYQIVYKSGVLSEMDGFFLNRSS